MILILTAGYGEGHNAAARGLLAACEQLGVDAEIVDAFALGGGKFYQKTRSWYLLLINRFPNLWAGIFRWIDRQPVGFWSMPFLGAIRSALEAVLDSRKPQWVVSVYPAYSYLIQESSKSTHASYPICTVITDSITINSIWYRCESDVYIVPNELSRRVLLDAGVDAARTRVLGFPVLPKFWNSRVDRPLPDVSRPRVLFMVNAGRDLAPEIVRRLLDQGGIELTVTVGRDESLAAEIRRIAAGRSVNLYGWTDQMPELLMNHHLLIGKAGGAAVQECLAARTPMLITQVVPGQEEGNAQLMVNAGCAEVCGDPMAIAARVHALFSEGAKLWKRWEQNIGQLSRPRASVEIVESLIGMREGKEGAVIQKSGVGKTGDRA
jgi:processive 1,2-diacylglycerol beta-glucosyltransferase